MQGAPRVRTSRPARHCRPAARSQERAPAVRAAAEAVAQLAGLSQQLLLADGPRPRVQVAVAIKRAPRVRARPRRRGRRGRRRRRRGRNCAAAGRRSRQALLLLRALLVRLHARHRVRVRLSRARAPCALPACVRMPRRQQWLSRPDVPTHTRSQVDTPGVQLCCASTSRAPSHRYLGTRPEPAGPRGPRRQPEQPCFRGPKCAAHDATYVLWDSRYHGGARGAHRHALLVPLQQRLRAVPAVVCVHDARHRAHCRCRRRLRQRGWPSRRRGGQAQQAVLRRLRPAGVARGADAAAARLREGCLRWRARPGAMSHAQPGAHKGHSAGAAAADPAWSKGRAMPSVVRPNTHRCCAYKDAQRHLVRGCPAGGRAAVRPPCSASAHVPAAARRGVPRSSATARSAGAPPAARSSRSRARPAPR